MEHFGFIFLDQAPDIKGGLFPNISTLIAHLIAFVVLLFIIYRFAWQPFKKFVKSREDYIHSNIVSSEDKLHLSLENIQKSQEALQHAKQQADEIIEASKLEAYKLNQKIISKSQKEIELQRQNFNNEMEQVKNKFFKLQKNIIIDTAYQISREFIKTNNSEASDKQFIEKLLSKRYSKKPVKEKKSK